MSGGWPGATLLGALAYLGVLSFVGRELLTLLPAHLLPGWVRRAAGASGMALFGPRHEGTAGA